ncbi:hypothetical protein [Rhabdaerophilum calidifontis]|uniref:hypothetical protein n=1 Tax=Rhabdaerophilum calidifontis TaxID=2604328 RepID=UPI001239243B|nr:hypothetical protein [Rhabdaerophilum calidifontis]
MVNESPEPEIAREPVERLAGILLSSLVALAEAGRVEEACRHAGAACVALRRSDPRAARRFDVLLHRLSPRLDW